MSRLPFLLQRAAAYRARLALIGALAVLSSLTTLALPWLAGQLVSGVLDLGGLPVNLVAALLAASLVATTLLNVAAGLLSGATSIRIVADLRLAIHERLLHLPMAFHDNSRQGDLLALATHEAGRLSTFLTGSIALAPSRLMTAAGALAVLFAIDPVLALFVPVVIPAAFIAMRLVGRHLRLLARDRREAEAEVVVAAETDLAMLPAIRAFAVEARHRAAYARVVEQSAGLMLRESRIHVVLEPAIGLFAAGGAIVLLLAAGTASMADGAARSPAELFSFLLYAALLTRPVGSLAALWGEYQTASGALLRMQAVLQEQPEPGVRAAALPPTPRPAAEIAFEDVTFAYPGRAPVLRAANLAIRAGTTLAIVGENGAGKSTLVNLLLRFYEPQAGRVAIGGQDIRDLPLDVLRRCVGLVPQRPLLFNGTVRDNIAFGLPGATDAQVAAAARLAQAGAFIDGLPQGLSTPIGDHGVRLSGGQRQRIALARALLADPPILVFDEATSMFDLESESAFVAACRTALAGRTVIVITHRPASLALADRIVEVTGGQAVERPLAGAGS